MKILQCPKHDKESTLRLNCDILPSGDRRFYVSCPQCGKRGAKRATAHGAEMAWNEMCKGFKVS